MTRDISIMRSIEQSIYKKINVRIKSENREKKNVEARMMFSYLMRMNGIGVSDISKFLGKTKSSVKYYINIYGESLVNDEYWSSMYDLHQEIINTKGGGHLTLLFLIRELQNKNKELNLELKSIKKQLRCTE
jgi:hypothetical protein